MSEGAADTNATTDGRVQSYQPADLKPLRELRLAHWVLVGLGLAGFAFLLLFSVFGAKSGARLTMLTWGATAAFASLATGLIIGLLFGLPNVRRVEITNTESSGDAGARSARLGYSESTNLEQVADWLTKIIIGLTLTQFALLESRFAQLSYDLSCFLLAGEGCKVLTATVNGTVLYPPGSTVPGGFVMTFYAVLGFLIGYMWMRGYFISEMEAAKANAIITAYGDQIKAAQEKLNRADTEAGEAKAKAAEATRVLEKAEADKRQIETDLLTVRQSLESAEDKAKSAVTQAQADREEFERQLKQARDAGRALERPQITMSELVEATAASAVTIANDAAAAAPEGAATRQAQEVVKKVEKIRYPDDPWRGSFGGQPSQKGYTLEGIVKARDDNPDYFDVTLQVVADSEKVPDAPGKSVKFFLHPTFGREASRSVSFNQSGVAPFPPLIAYGAFTVGALIDDGTVLELNLATIDGVPDGFLSR